MLAHPGTRAPILAAMNDLQRAETSYRKALAIEPRFPEVMNKLGVTYAKMGRLEDAKTLFKKRIDTFPFTTAPVHVNLGNCYQLEGNYAMAEKEYRMALFLSPENRQALRRLALLYDVMKNPKAQEIWEKYNDLINQNKEKVRRGGTFQ